MASFKDHIPGVVIGCVVTLLLSGSGYIWVIKDHAKELDHLSRQLTELADRQEKHIGRLDGSLNASEERLGQLRIFIATMHPDRYAPHLTSATKLGDLPTDKLEEFSRNVSETLPYYKVVRGHVNQLTAERVDVLLGELSEKNSEASANIENVANELGLNRSEWRDFYQQGEIKQYLDEGQINAEDFNFAYKVLAIEPLSQGNDEVNKKRDELVESLIRQTGNSPTMFEGNVWDGGAAADSAEERD